MHKTEIYCDRCGKKIDAAVVMPMETLLNCRTFIKMKYHIFPLKDRYDFCESCESEWGEVHRKAISKYKDTIMNWMMKEKIKEKKNE